MVFSVESMLSVYTCNIVELLAIPGEQWVILGQNNSLEIFNNLLGLM